MFHFSNFKTNKVLSNIFMYYFFLPITIFPKAALMLLSKKRTNCGSLHFANEAIKKDIGAYTPPMSCFCR